MGLAIRHPVLVPDAVQFRGYQANLARIAGEKDTLVVLPTGMGKTIVALLAIADAWKNGTRHILLMAPTRPLVDQHAAFLEATLATDWGGSVHALTGHISPEKRQAAYAQEGIVVATPQVVHNDILADRLAPLPDWVIYDECHRAVGDYPYAFIGDTFRARAKGHRRLGLTASPGHDVEKINEVRMHLGLDHVEIRTPDDPDVAAFIQDVATEWETLPLPPTMDKVRRHLDEALLERVKALRALKLLSTDRVNRRTLLEVAAKAQKAIKSTSDPDPSWFQALTLQAQAMKIQHALELVQTQGAASFVVYMEQMRKEADGPKASKASRAIVEDPRVNQAYHVARFDDAENPKMGRVETLVAEQLAKEPDSRVIVFTHYRTTCEQVAARLATKPGLRPVVFVGQGKRKGSDGLTQKQQTEILQQFRQGAYNVLVATSVAEEGLDIPATDLVVFYEPIPSEIRSIQRRGRTGRNREGRVVVLMTKGTPDEAAHWSSRRKEQAMIRELHGLRALLAGGMATQPAAPGRGQTRLDRVAPSSGGTTAKPARAGGNPAMSSAAAGMSFGNGPVIVCDHREQPGGVVRQLHQLGARIETRTLEVADFILSDRVAVERKTADDFVDSLIDGRLFDQMKGLKEYPRPFLVIEGDGLHGHRNLSPEAIMGAVASVTVDYGIPILQTRDNMETARFLLAVAKREQGRAGRHIAVRGARATQDDDGISQAALSQFPGISEVRAAALLRAFGSLQAILAASEAELAAVESIGPKTAAELRRILSRPYTG